MDETRKTPEQPDPDSIVFTRARPREAMDVWASLLAMPTIAFLVWYFGTLFVAVSLFSQNFWAGLFVTAVQTFIFGKAALWR